MVDRWTSPNSEAERSLLSGRQTWVTLPSPLSWLMKVDHGSGSSGRKSLCSLETKQIERDQERGLRECMDKHFAFNFHLRLQPLRIAYRLCRMMPGWPCSRVPSQEMKRGCSPVCFTSEIYTLAQSCVCLLL